MHNTHESAILDLEDRMQALNDQAQHIKAQAEGRDLTAEEAATVDAIFAEFTKAEAEIERRTKLSELAAKISRGTGPKTQQQIHGQGPTSRGIPMFKNAHTGEMVMGYRGVQPMFASRNEMPLGDLLAGILLNDPDRLPADVRASLTTGSDTGGGYLVTPQFSQRVVDLARANSVCVRAGATTVPMNSSEMSIARVTADATSYWRGETAATTASVPTFGRYTLRPKMLAAIVPVSIELLEDAPNMGALIESTLMKSLGAELDRVLLTGSGVGNEPLGILNTSGVNSQTAVGVVTDYDEVSNAVRDILIGNYSGEISGLSWIMHPAIAGAYDRVATGITSDNTPLPPSQWARDLRRFITTAFAEEGNSPIAYPSIIGDFSQLLVGMRTSGVVFDVLDSGSVTDGSSVSWNASTQFLRFIRARLRVDCVVLQPTHFSVMTGISQV